MYLFIGCLLITSPLLIVTSGEIWIHFTEIEWRELQSLVSGHDLQRLEKYSSNLADRYLVTDLLPNIAMLFFLNKFSSVHLSPVQSVSTFINYSVIAWLNSYFMDHTMGYCIQYSGMSLAIDFTKQRAILNSSTKGYFHGILLHFLFCWNNFS